MRTYFGLGVFTLAALLAGCSGNASGEFREFSERDKKTPTRQTPAAKADAENDTSPDTKPQAPDLEVPADATQTASRSPNSDVIEFGGQKFQWEKLPPAVAEKAVREITLLIPEKTFQKTEPDDVLRVSYDDIDLLRVLNMDPVPADCMDYFPDWLLALDGERIRIRGFMFPPELSEDLPGFVLARDNQICCFGRDPKRYDVMEVYMKKGTTTDYIPNRPFDVVGTFHIEPEAYRGELIQLYYIDDASVITR